MTSQGTRGGAGGAADIQANRARQTLIEPHGAFEDRLGDALEAAFSSGATELSAIVSALNAAGAVARDGRPWTEETFRAEMARLGR